MIAQMTSEGTKRGPRLTSDDISRRRDMVLSGRRISKEWSEILSSSHLTTDDWLILDSLRQSDGITMSELVKLLVLPPATLTRFVDRLVDNALVYRRPNPFDKRQIRIFISENGVAALRKATEEMRAEGR